MRKWIPFLLTAALAAGTAIAQNATESTPGAIERHLERMEQAIARLEAQLNGRRSSRDMMEGCRDMRRGSMGGMHDGGQPNEQSRPPETKR